MFDCVVGADRYARKSYAIPGKARQNPGRLPSTVESVVTEMCNVKADDWPETPVDC